MLILFGEGYDFFYEATYFGGIVLRPSRMMRFVHKPGTLLLLLLSQLYTCAIFYVFSV